MTNIYLYIYHVCIGGIFGEIVKGIRGTLVGIALFEAADKTASIGSNGYVIISFPRNKCLDALVGIALSHTRISFNTFSIYMHIIFICKYKYIYITHTRHPRLFSNTFHVREDFC